MCHELHDPRSTQRVRILPSGVFLVENGRVTGAVRATGEEAFEMVVPAMNVHIFRFSEVTKF